jgi:hypothetical protein
MSLHIKRPDLTEKHKPLQDLLTWDELLKNFPATVPAVPCALKKGVLDLDRKIVPTQGNIYVDNILAARVS